MYKNDSTVAFSPSDLFVVCGSDILPLRIELISNPKVKKKGQDIFQKVSSLPNILEFVSKDFKRKKRMKNGNHKACFTAII